MQTEEGLEGAEVTLGQILEAPPAGGEGGVERVTRLDGPEQMLVVLAQLHLDGPGERRIAREIVRRARRVTTRVDEGVKAESFQVLGHRAPIPAEGARRGLHVEAVAT